MRVQSIRTIHKTSHEKIKVVITFIIVLAFTISCRHTEKYKLLNSMDDIIEISIVALSFENDGSLQVTKCKTIENINEFMEDFRSVTCYTYFGDPVAATTEGTETTAVEILYQNGEYEIINWKGQTKYTLTRGLTYYAGFSVFDEQQFVGMIQKYAG